jgi:hypothetical protein
MDKTIPFYSNSLANTSCNNKTLVSSCKTDLVGRKLKKKIRYFQYLKNKKYFDAYLLAEKLLNSEETKKIFNEQFPSNFI